MSLSYYTNNLPSEGWKKAKKKEVASKMTSKEYKTTRCGKCGKFGHHHSAHSDGKSYSAAELMEIDKGIWKKLKISSRTDMDNKGLHPLYKRLVKQEVAGKVHPIELDVLTDNNYHSMRDAIEN